MTIMMTINNQQSNQIKSSIIFLKNQPIKYKREEKNFWQRKQKNGFIIRSLAAFLIKINTERNNTSDNTIVIDLNIQSF